jgi:hypothetical protein
VSSVRGLRKYSRHHNLCGLDDDTLVEINLVGCMISDEAILAQVSATATGLSGPAHAMALVPVSWYENLPKLRDLLDVPDDLRSLDTAPPAVAAGLIKKRRLNLREAVRLEESSGRELAERWKRATHNHLRLSEMTRAWFSVCEEKIPENLAVDYLRARKILANIFIRKTHRKVIADFCRKLSDVISAEHGS